jgi:hypothetical protein
LRVFSEEESRFPFPSTVGLLPLGSESAAPLATSARACGGRVAGQSLCKLPRWSRHQ